MTYIARVGLNYHDAKGRPQRAEPGAVVKNLPPRSVPWLLEQQLIAPAEAPKEEQDGRIPRQ